MSVSQKSGLPRVRPKARRPSVRQETTAPTATMQAIPEQFKIVVADDSRIYRSLVERILVEEGYIVLFAEDGREALAAMAKHQPCLLVTDWEMPDISGIELCKKIRRDYESYVHIILLTSNTDKDQIVEGLAAGADDYLTKPFHPGELLARVAVGRRVAELHRQLQAKTLLLEELAQTDSLTGLPNRRVIEDWTKRELCGAERHGFGLWLVMADLDHFKSINDTYGHEAGDLVLKRFAEILRRNTRSSNLCGRMEVRNSSWSCHISIEPGLKQQSSAFVASSRPRGSPSAEGVLRSPLASELRDFRGATLQAPICYCAMPMRHCIGPSTKDGTEWNFNPELHL